MAFEFEVEVPVPVPVLPVVLPAEDVPVAVDPYICNPPFPLMPSPATVPPGQNGNYQGEDASYSTSYSSDF